MLRPQLWLLALAILRGPQIPALAKKSSVATSSDTVYLVPGTSINVKANIFGSAALRTFCYMGKMHSVESLLETMEFYLAIESEDFSQYGGKTAEEVLEHYNKKQSLFSLTLFSQKRHRIQLSPFDQQCIGIASRQPYSVTLNQLPLDMWRLLQLGAGLLVFWISRRLAKNNVFYYLIGVLLCICASVLVIIYLFAKLLSRGPMMYAVLVGGWTIGFYVLKKLVDNMRLILLSYRDYVLWYIVITGLISFLICYRIGPPKNPRSQDVIMWVLQAMGGALMYFSTWHTTAAIFLMVFTFVAYYFAPSLVQCGKYLHRRRFSPQRRLLTKEEYYQQTVKETAKGLSELRTYVHSPECKQWNLITKLNNPTHFAGFANGAPHLHDEEIEDYSRSIEASMEMAPEEDPEEFLQSSMYYRPASERFGLCANQRHRLNFLAPVSQDEESDYNEYMD